MSNLHSRQHSRIITADAGSTPSRGRNANPTQDHPRGCGEHQQQQTDYHLQQGSSPRMRGAPRQNVIGDPNSRIIPADAGSTSSGHVDDLIYRDHPRGCGEHTSHGCTGHRILQDHPRGCGEHHICVCGQPVNVGSSPRMRGAHRLGLHLERIQRIIPADAGSTRFTRFPLEQIWDHPRGCGEHGGDRPSGACIRGSSPRMRGAQPFPTTGTSSSGIIPADAGSTGRDCLIP